MAGATYEKYEIIYNYGDAENIRDTFEGSYWQLREVIKGMREDGCFNIEANLIPCGMEW